MSSSRCTSCGLIHQLCQCHRQTSTTSSDKPQDMTPACCCTSYFSVIAFFLFFFIGLPMLTPETDCYVELFADSVSVSNANVSAADWRIGFVARSPVTGCKVSINTLNARLFRGDQVISNFSSPSSGYYFGQFVNGDTTDVLFENVVMLEVTGDVIWNIRVEVLIAFDKDASRYFNGFFVAVCPAIPVKFTTDPEGKVTGSLLGNMRRCNYEFRRTLVSSH